MRILTVNTHFAPITFGGATLVAEESAVRLAQRGHEVHVFTSLPDHLLAYGHLRRYEARGLPVVAVGRRTPRTADEEYHQPALARRLGQVLHALQPDVVHFHAVQGMGIEMVRLCAEQGVPTVVTLHDAWWLCERQFMVRGTGEWCGQAVIDPHICATCVSDAHQHRARQVESLQILNSCSRVLTPSTYWLDLMRGSGVAADVLEVNRNGVLHPASTPTNTRTGEVRFGYVGGADIVKGAQQLRQALGSLQDVPLSMTLVDANQFLGLPGLRPEQWQFPGTRIVPAYTSETMDAFFESIDVLVFPSQTRESYGLTVREALLRGVWVIATEGGATDEVLVDSVNATLIPLGSSHAALAAAMREIAAEPDRYRNVAQPTSPIPTFDDQAAELERLYTRLQAERTPLPLPRMPLSTAVHPSSVPGSSWV